MVTKFGLKIAKFSQNKQKSGILENVSQNYFQKAKNYKLSRILF